MHETAAGMETEAGTEIAATSARSVMSQAEVVRYQRQLLVADIGPAGQAALLRSSVVMVGCGGLCAGALPSMAGAGVGCLTLVDGDVIDPTNLHRQTIYRTCDQGQYKAVAAEAYVRALNPGCQVQTESEFLTPNNALRLFENADLILDCTDSLPARRLISDAAEITARNRHRLLPVISGSALKMQGHILLYGLETTHTYRTLLGSQSWLQRCLQPGRQDCATAGIFGPVPQIIGHLMAASALKVLMGHPLPEWNFMLYDLATSKAPFQCVRLKPRTAEPAIEAFVPADYITSCGAGSSSAVSLPWLETITWQQSFDLGKNGKAVIYVDARPITMSQVGSMPNARLIPAALLQAKALEALDAASLDPVAALFAFEPESGSGSAQSGSAQSGSDLTASGQAGPDIHFYCRRGNASRNCAETLCRLVQSSREWGDHWLQHVQVCAVTEGFSVLVDNFPGFRDLLVI
ncbi:putative molybdopterin biosynthesis protein [Gregarina niphandrodes]|uniref:Molybdopterin biosynthesis protein n=1 Tax=Gregarina niphandrodes TaxID=110365 RepID=A0A023AYI8_GRENI|nr:putative molybdopterin biosynthesis protein [Gregarina niphandrodes]EZG43714.1 putative molybdopterin biosynthesis protein [Gregarina niphandrodes]|eukprot:XP_011133044.1 putative molybdopterin biosynthesis protein [Gregarina niphandrodes]